MNRIALVCAALVLTAGQALAGPSWQTILTEDFSGRLTDWTYAGVTNGGGQNLIRPDGAGGLRAEWDQANGFNGAGDPYGITPSSYSRSLGKTLTDSDTFKFGAKLNITSVVDTTEFFQAANFGLYSLADMGADRTMSDNWSGNSTLVKDASDFVEFNYFINNNSFGFNPNTQATIGAHITGLDGDYITGSGTVGDSLWHSTDMGADNWLPTAQDLFVEVTYDAASRRAHSAIYTDSARTTLLSVNSVEQYYWTLAMDAGDHFSLTDVAFYNYVGSNWGGANGSGLGTFDDLYVAEYVPEPATVSMLLVGAVGLWSRRRRNA